MLIPIKTSGDMCMKVLYKTNLVKTKVEANLYWKQSKQLTTLSPMKAIADMGMKVLN